MKIALDPTPFHATHSLLEFPRLVKDLGYDYLQMTPHPDFIPFFNHPKADDDLVARLGAACKDAGVEIASILPVMRWSSPDPDAREAAVRNWKRIIRIAVDWASSSSTPNSRGAPNSPRNPNALSTGRWRSCSPSSSARACTWLSTPTPMTSSSAASTPGG